jgi:SpoVK/Ycf46/Vps4 family AAA+-type ATPase
LEFSRFSAEEPKYGFEDIILNKTTFDAIQDVLAIYEKRDLLFNQWGLGVTHKQHNRAGINLYGEPGTGKSMAAHAIAKQLGRKILTVDYSQIESKYKESKTRTKMIIRWRITPTGTPKAALR